MNNSWRSLRDKIQAADNGPNSLEEAQDYVSRLVSQAAPNSVDGLQKHISALVKENTNPVKRGPYEQ